MKIQKVLLAIFGVFGFSVAGGVTASYPAQAAVQQQCKGLSEEECCQLALEKNTVEALEEFLRLFPPGRGSSACSALAINALLPDEPRDTHEGPPDNGYNQ